MTNWGLEEPEREQIDSLSVLLRDILLDTIVAAYLHGSAVLGGLRPYSDLDLMVVTERPTTAREKLEDLGVAPSAYGRRVAGEIRRLADPSTGP